MTAAETCRQNGWEKGDVLEGDEGYGPERILLTAIGESAILARTIFRRGEPVDERECLWSLECRDWRKVTG
jgi:hypothetical protein